MKSALITGITGQDGSYLAEDLLQRGYTVHGLVRPSSTRSRWRIDHLCSEERLHLHEGDLTDGSRVTRLLAELAPDEVYNLAAQTHVAKSFESPELTAEVNALGVVRLLSAIRTLGLGARTRFYQASTSELFGAVPESPQSEQTPFHPRSPYGASKLHAHWVTVNSREAHGLFACCGILFNHESPRRGEEFVTRKITRGLARASQGLQGAVPLGNLDARRDWGHARDYVRMQWQMLQQEVPEDFVIATGTQHSVREFVSWAGEDLGISLSFEGKGSEEVARVSSVTGESAAHVVPGQVLVRVEPQLFRPTEVGSLCGDASKAKRRLGWRPTVSARQLCTEMVAADLDLALKERFSQASDPV
ncbi:MAG: GDP-mannose 4,6-dehydratase [Planctomycetes bacterium]|nr:GDP-mannose 4,6-dehydratase [Planctomycetota bacterium]